MTLPTDKVLALAKQAGAVSYSPPPMRAVRGVSFEFDQLNDFAALIQQQMIADGWRSPDQVKAIANDKLWEKYAVDELIDRDKFLAALESQPVPVEPAIVGWLEHHKAGDNIGWEQVDHHYAKADALIKKSDYDTLRDYAVQADIAAKIHAKDVFNLTEKVIPNIRERAEKAEAILIQHYCDYEFKPTLEQAVELMLEERREKKATEAENAALRKDAERYRWLRDQHEGKLPIEMDADGFPMPQEVAALAFTVFYPDPTGDESLVVVPTGNLDETIDAAIDSAGAE